MTVPFLPVACVFALIASAGFYLGKRRGRRLAAAAHSSPGQFGALVVLWCTVPVLVTLLAFSVARPLFLDAARDTALEAAAPNATEVERETQRAEVDRYLSDPLFRDTWPDAIVASADAVTATRTRVDRLQLGCMLVLALAGVIVTIGRIRPRFQVRRELDAFAMVAMFACSSVAIVTTIAIAATMLLESIRFFGEVPLTEFLFGTNWSPQLAIREDQIGSTGSFGALPVFTGTILITVVAMCVAIPVGVLAAVYLAEYATVRFRTLARPLLEVLAGIPTVVYGFFAALVVAPLLRDLGSQAGLTVSSESALAVGLVMGIMIIPFVSSLADDAIISVPRELRDGALSLGATRAETIWRVVLPAAAPGVAGGVLLATSRALGETMIVVMAAGLGPNLTANPLQSVTTVTGQIVSLLVGDQGFSSTKTLAAFALGLTLFVATLILNLIALYAVRSYRRSRAPQ